YDASRRAPLRKSGRDRPSGFLRVRATRTGESEQDELAPGVQYGVQAGSEETENRVGDWVDLMLDVVLVVERRRLLSDRFRPMMGHYIFDQPAAGLLLPARRLHVRRRGFGVLL